MREAGEGVDDAEALCVELATLAVAVTGFLKATGTGAATGMALVERDRLDALERASLRAYLAVAACSGAGHGRPGGVDR